VGEWLIALVLALNKPWLCYFQFNPSIHPSIQQKDGGYVLWLPLMDTKYSPRCYVHIISFFFLTSL
jgi:hypothetical protein